MLKEARDTKMEKSTVQVWCDGSELILKRVHNDFLYRFADEPGDWQKGLPEGIVPADAYVLINNQLY